jgi:hypothetical protein
MASGNSGERGLRRKAGTSATTARAVTGAGAGIDATAGGTVIDWLDGAGGRGRSGRAGLPRAWVAVAEEPAPAAVGGLAAGGGGVSRSFGMV